MIEVTVSMDRFSGTPYVKIVAHVKDKIHHARMTTAMDRLARKLWGDKGLSIRHGHNVYTLVWAGSDAPIPAALTDIQCTTFSDTLDIEENRTR